MLKIEDLSLTAIDAVAHTTLSEELVSAVGYAARRGYGNYTALRFVTALVITDNLRHTAQWSTILRKIEDLKIEADVAALESARWVNPVEGEVEGS